MMSSFKNILRVGLFKEFDYSSQTAIVQMFDRSTGNTIERCDMPPAAWGMYSFPKRNTRVLVGYGYRERPFIVSILPSSALAQDFTKSNVTTNISVNDVQYPRLESGEVAIQGLKNSQLLFKSTGDIKLLFGKSLITFSSHDIYTESSAGHYLNTEAGRWLSGTIKRDLRKTVSETNKTADKLSSINYELVLSEIGKNPIYRTAVVTNNLGNTGETIRNPSLVEEHHLTYEFARSHMIGSSDEEKERVFQNTQNKSFLNQPNRRDMARTDALNLNDMFRNNLIEEIRGTVVDRYGNVLDLNRNIIDYKFSDSDIKDKNIRPDTEDIYLRRAIKYHFEINARKDKAFGKPNYNSTDGPDVKNGHPHSRWFIDVDGEGLTKINIPASSNAGNIPVLARYLNTSIEKGDLTDSFRDSNSPPRDVTHLAFGDSSSGISVDKNYLPPKVTKVVTAYHDIVNTASSPLFPDFAVTGTIDNNFKNNTANAGGKSAHINLDGSLELNVGRDIIDHKSIILDTSGSIVSRVGKDIRSNSIVSQIDGNIAIQVGGDTISNSTATEEPVPDPTIKIYIKTANGNFDKIEITKDAIVIESSPNKNIVFKSGNNIILDAAGKTFIGGEAIMFYGTASRDGKTLAPERLMIRNGLEIK